MEKFQNQVEFLKIISEDGVEFNIPKNSKFLQKGIFKLINDGDYVPLTSDDLKYIFEDVEIPKDYIIKLIKKVLPFSIIELEEKLIKDLKSKLNLKFTLKKAKYENDIFLDIIQDVDENISFKNFKKLVLKYNKLDFQMDKNLAFKKINENYKSLYNYTNLDADVHQVFLRSLKSLYILEDENNNGDDENNNGDDENVNGDDENVNGDDENVNGENSDEEEYTDYYGSEDEYNYREEEYYNNEKYNSLREKGIIREYDDFINYLIENYIDNFDYIDEYNGKRLIHYICKGYKPNMVKYLIEKGVDLECKDNKGRRPLHYICFNLYSGIKDIELLIEKKVYIECEDYKGRRPIHYICYKCNQLPFLKYFCDLGVNLECEDNNKMRPIHFLCKTTKLNFLIYIIKKGVNLECENKNKMRPIHFACENYDEEIFKCIVNERVNLECKDIDNFKPVISIGSIRNKNHLRSEDKLEYIFDKIDHNYKIGGVKLIDFIYKSCYYNYFVKYVELIKEKYGKDYDGLKGKVDYSNAERHSGFQINDDHFKEYIKNTNRKFKN